MNLRTKLIIIYFAIVCSYGFVHTAVLNLTQFDISGFVVGGAVGFGLYQWYENKQRSQLI